MRLKNLTPQQLLLIARRDLQRTAILGATSSPGIWDRTVQAWNEGLEAAANVAVVPFKVARDTILESGAKLYQTAAECMKTGSTAAGEAIATLAGKMADGLASLGAGAGRALADMLGASPAAIGGVGAILVVLLGLGLFLTPGGQALIPSVGRALTVGAVL